jgi:hypothetical protein
MVIVKRLRTFLIKSYNTLLKRIGIKESNTIISNSQILSNREGVDKAIGYFLKSMNYPSSIEVVKGLVELVDMISDYHEEGLSLYPDVLFVSSLDYFKTIEAHLVKIYEGTIESHSFTQCIKLCAPLAVNGWNIYIVVDIKDNHIEYGLLTTELKILSLSLYDQTMITGVPEENCIYIRNVGNRVVEFRNVEKTLIIENSLSGGNKSLDQTINDLAHNILSQGGDELREARNFIKKNIHQALNEGHGNLIAVIYENEESIRSVMKKLHGGVMLDNPFDLQNLVENYKSQSNEIESMSLRSYANLVREMLNFDGITLFTDHGRVLGYHFIVNNNVVEEENVQGGSRTRAFMALAKHKDVRACFMKSQDGKIKIEIK